MDKAKPVLVATLRGVFFGYLQGEVSPEKVTLAECRMVVRWVGTHGLPGLAKNGPGDECRISPAAPLTEILGSHGVPITLVATCTPAAVSRFEMEPWL